MYHFLLGLNLLLCLPAQCTVHIHVVSSGRFGISDWKIFALTTGYIVLTNVFGINFWLLEAPFTIIATYKTTFFSLSIYSASARQDVLVKVGVVLFQRKPPSCLMFDCFHCEMVRLLDTVCQRLEENHLSSQVSCCLKSLELH